MDLSDGVKDSNDRWKISKWSDLTDLSDILKDWYEVRN